MAGTVWIVNPYGTLPGEAWATYRSTLLGERLAARGYSVTQFLSNFEHRSKTFRPPAPGGIQIAPGYRIELIPSTAYERHISVARVRYERAYARHLLTATHKRARPDFIVLAEPSLFYYDLLLRPLLRTRRVALVLDIIDIWPELFALVIPPRLRPLSGPLLAPFHGWRRRLFRHADAVVAVARDYLEIAAALVDPARVPLEVVYWSFDERKDAEPASGAAHDRLTQLIAAKAPGDVWAVYAGTLGDNYDIPAVLALGGRLPSALRPRVNLKVLVAGDGPLAGMCREHAGPDLEFLGRLAGADLAALYRHTDIALSTYRGESTVAMPIKAFDHLRFGLPMVNSLGRDLGRLVTEHEIGINYEPGSAASLAAAVERLAGEAPLRRRMAARAAALAPAFAPERQYGKFADLLDRLAHRRASTQCPVRVVSCSAVMPWKRPASGTPRSSSPVSSRSDVSASVRKPLASNNRP